MEPRLWLPQTHKGAVFNHTEYPGFVIHTSLCPKTHTHSPVHTHTHTRHTYESPHHVHACTTPPHAHTHTHITAHTIYMHTDTHAHTHKPHHTHTHAHTPLLPACSYSMLFPHDIHLALWGQDPHAVPGTQVAWPQFTGCSSRDQDCHISLLQPFSRKTEESVLLRCKVACPRSCRVVQGQARLRTSLAQGQDLCPISLPWSALTLQPC